jgi:hypothetical protein
MIASQTKHDASNINPTQQAEVAMKKILALVLALALTTSFALSQTTGKAKTPASADTPQRGAMFIDKDGNGICDNFDKKSGTGMQYGKGQGKGMGKGNGHGRGAGNCTGVCDGTGPKGKRAGK